MLSVKSVVDHRSSSGRTRRRLVDIRFMELHGYLDHGDRVLSARSTTDNPARPRFARPQPKVGVSRWKKDVSQDGNLSVHSAFKLLFRTHAMKQFLHRWSSEIKGTLSGFDRVRFRGTIRWLASLEGMGSYLGTSRVHLKEFKDWATDKTDRIQEATEKLAESAGRPVVYLPSSSERKEARALEIARADGITEGLIAVLKCVEPCHTFTVGPNAEKRKLELRSHPGKCSHLYFYSLHHDLGLMHLRLQTWAPFTIHVCLNGREWLARRLTRAGIGFEQRDNCFVDVDDLPRAQKLLSGQLRTDWTKAMEQLVTKFHPAHRTMFGRPLDYYWSAEETEWATDVMFHSREALANIYPNLLRHGITTFGSSDVLRFLGQLPIIRRDSTREILSSVKTRPEGTRLKHALNRNSIKMYDKQELVLRIETTINDPPTCGSSARRRAIRTDPSRGSVCAKEWPIFIVVLTSARRPTSVIWSPWPPSGTISRLARRFFLTANRPNSKDVACARYSHSATRTERFWPP